MTAPHRSQGPRLIPQALLLIVLLGLSISVFSQSDSATLSGTVTDPSGAVIAGAVVRVTNVETDITARTTSNGSGLYVVGNLHPGHYRVLVEKLGFAQIALTDLTLNVQDTLSRNFQLRVGTASETVTVSGDVVQLNTESAAVSTVVDQQFVENMPLNGRTFQSLIALVPGVTFTPANNASPGQFSVNGQRTDSNYFMVDGVSANIGASSASNLGDTFGGTTPGFTQVGGTNGLVSVDAMQEFRIQTSSYAPEFGRSPGGQISVATKSGTNLWHGNAFDYLRNDLFDARDYFNRAPAKQPPLRQNDFGGTLGGPIWKNKTFFFFSYEGLRLLLPQTAIGHFYTAAARVQCPSSGPIPALCVSAVWKPIVDALPLPNGPVDPNGRTALLTTSYSNPSNLNATSLRIDHTLNDKISLFARYNHAPSNGLIRGFSNLTNNQANTDTATAGATITLSTNKVNDFRANWSRSTGSSNSYGDNFMGAVPAPVSVLFGPYNPATTQTQFGFMDTTGGVFGGRFTGNVQRQLNFIDSLSLVEGKHQLKFGVDWRRLTPTSAFSNPGVLAVQNTYSNLQAGTIGDFNIAAGNQPSNFLLNNYSLYAQDTWKTTNKLTLTYGLRWEINPPPALTNGPLYHVTGLFDGQPPGALVTTPVYGTKLGSFAPRFGAAYQLTPNTVVRGGFGLFYDLGVSSAVASEVSVYPFYRTIDVTGQSLNFNTLPGPPPFPNPLTPPNGSNADAGGGTVSAVDPNLGLPVTYQWNVAVERQLGKSQALTVSYIGSAGRNLLRNDAIAPVAATSPWNTVIAVRNADRSDYKALQTEFQRRMSHGLQVLASYTLAKSMDSASNDFGNAIVSQTLAQLSNAANVSYGYSNFDVRNSYSAGISYQLPAPEWGRVSNAVLKGWAVDSIIRGRSGFPFTVNDFHTQILLDGALQTTRPNVVPGQPFWIDKPTAPGGRVLNPAAFTDATGNLPGDLVRNSLRDFGAAQTDLAVRRRFNITERVKLDFRAEYFNLFNHPMFSFQPFGTNFGSPSFGVANKTLANAFSGNNGTGQNQLYTMGENRSGQFTLKLSF